MAPVKMRSWRVTGSYLAVAALLALFGLDSALRSSTGAGTAAGLAAGTAGVLLGFLSLRIVVEVSDAGIRATNLVRSRIWRWEEIEAINTRWRQLTPLTRPINFGHLAIRAHVRITFLFAGVRPLRIKGSRSRKAKVVWTRSLTDQRGQFAVLATAWKQAAELQPLITQLVECGAGRFEVAFDPSVFPTLGRRG